MYPPRDRSEEVNKPVSDVAYWTYLGFAWLVLAGFAWFASHKPGVTAARATIAGCAWLNAVLLRMGWTTRTRILSAAAWVISGAALCYFTWGWPQ
jgi:hypothetical protein